MLYGDWGTSRFYVLGLALFYALHASFWYVFAVGVLVAAVGWAYTIICRCYPDGGGVYSAAKHTNRQLAVVGALLLFADYIVTASISAFDGIRYMGVPKEYVAYIAMGAILLVGVINYIGPKKAGTVALVVAIATLALTIVLTLFSIPHLAAGWHLIHRPTEAVHIQWTNFVAVVLALSGVEAIANMTGIMVPPVTKTSNKAIWPVLIEVVVLNLILAVAMNALPVAHTATYPNGYDLGKAPGNAYQTVADLMGDHADWKTNPEVQARINAEATLAKVTPEQLETQSAELREHIDDTQDAVLRVMAKVYVDPYLKIFSWISGFVFGALLLSAVNTAVADMVSIQYVMSRDMELPHVLTKLNIFGVPWYALIAAVGLPVGLLCIFQDVYTLANLYAVGVVGAIAINLGSCCVNGQMPVKKWERLGLGTLAAVMIAIEITLVCQKPDARYFALFVLCSGLAARFFTKTYPRFDAARRGYSLAAWAVVLLAIAGCLFHFEPTINAALAANVKVFQIPFAPRPHYVMFALACVLVMFGGTSATYAVRYLSGRMPAAMRGGVGSGTATDIAVAGVVEPAEAIDFSTHHVLVATRGGRRLLDFAANYCKKTGAAMFVLFVRQVNVAIAGGPSPDLDVNEDAEALRAFAAAREICAKAGVKMVPMYVVSSDVAYTILDFAATYAVEAVLMGVSREGRILRALRGDVITAVGDHLPEDIPLLIHA